MLKRTLLAFLISTTPVSVFASDISEPLPALYDSPELTASLHQESPQNTLEKIKKDWTSFVRCISNKYVDHDPCTQEHKTRVVSYLHELNATLGAVTEISQTRLIGIIDSYLAKLQKEFPPTCQKTCQELTRVKKAEKHLVSLKEHCSTLTEERSLGDWFDSAKKTVSKQFEEDNKKYLRYVRELITKHIRKIYEEYYNVKRESFEEFRGQQRAFEKFESEMRSILSDLNQNTLASVFKLCSSPIVDGLLDSLGTTRKILKIEADPLMLPKMLQILKNIWSLSHRSTQDNSLKIMFETQSNIRVEVDKQHQRTLSASIDEESDLLTEEVPLPQSVKKKPVKSKRTRDGESIPPKLETVDESSTESESETASSTKPSKPKHQPHDKFVKRTLQVIPIAIDLFQQVLPKNDLEYIDLSTLKLMDTTFIGDDMEKRIANTAFIVKLKSEESYLYLLVKHLSSPDESVLDKINGYQGQVLRHRNNFNKQEKEKYLIRVLTLVLYTGKGKLSQTICSRDSFRPNGCDSSIYLLDLREETEETLKIKFKAFLPAALALKMVRNNIRPNEIPGIALQGLRQHTEYINMLKTYILHAAHSNERDVYEEVLKGILEDDVENIEEDDALERYSQSAIRSREKELVKNMFEAGLLPDEISRVTKINIDTINKYLHPPRSSDKKKRHRAENDKVDQRADILDNFSPHVDNEVVDESERTLKHKYTSQDIARLFTQLPLEANFALDDQDNPPVENLVFRQGNTYVLPPVSTAGKLIIESLKALFDHSSSQTHPPRMILVPHNPGGHWVTLQFNIPENGDVTITYIDSLMNEDVAINQSRIDSATAFMENQMRALKQQIPALFNRNIVPTVMTTRIQSNDIDCGVLIVTNIMDILNGTPLPTDRCMTPDEIKTIREKHSLMLQKMGEDFEFEGLSPTRSQTRSEEKFNEAS